MVFAVLVAIAVAVTSCSDGSSAETTSSTPSRAVSDPAYSGAFFEIVVINFEEEPYVELHNFTDSSSTVRGMVLTQPPSSFVLPDVEVAPGETVKVAVGSGSGLEGLVIQNAELGELRPEDGEIAVFSSDDLNDPEAMLIYLQWGKTPHDLTDMAIGAGRWVEHAWAPSGPSAIRIFVDQDTGLWLWDSSE
jgi:hypothetical protein